MHLENKKGGKELKSIPVLNVQNARSLLKTTFLCEEEETLSFIDKVILVAYGVVITWVVLLMLMV